MFRNDCTVRRARESDLETIMRIEKASFLKYPYSFEVFEELLRRCPEYFLIAEYKGEVSGYVCGRLVRKDMG
ncbi:MAG: ribosomal protein S18-alanine N-acetyltransferase, partial [Thermoproteota archaeon]